VRILGKKDEPGRPILYGTTADFLEFFGLRTLSDLPTLREFTELNDESKRAYEREMGEEPPEEGPIEGGLMGGEGDIRKAPAEVTPPRPASDYEDPIEGEGAGDAGDAGDVGDGVNAGDGAERVGPVASEEEEHREGTPLSGEDVAHAHAHEDAQEDEDEDDEEDDEEDDDEDDDEDEDEDEEDDDEDDDDDEDEDEDDDDE
jgi:segregation and condensation protein B